MIWWYFFNTQVVIILRSHSYLNVISYLKMSGKHSQRVRFNSRGHGNDRGGGFQDKVIVEDSTIATTIVRTAHLSLEMRRTISWDPSELKWYGEVYQCPKKAIWYSGNTLCRRIKAILVWNWDYRLVSRNTGFSGWPWKVKSPHMEIEINLIEKEERTKLEILNIS